MRWWACAAQHCAFESVERARNLLDCDRGQPRNRELFLVEPRKLQGAEGERASIAHRRAAGAVGICLYIHCSIVQTILLVLHLYFIHPSHRLKDKYSRHRVRESAARSTHGIELDVWCVPFFGIPLPWFILNKLLS